MASVHFICKQLNDQRICTIDAVSYICIMAVKLSRELVLLKSSGHVSEQHIPSQSAFLKRFSTTRNTTWHNVIEGTWALPGNTTWHNVIEGTSALPRQCGLRGRLLASSLHSVQSLCYSKALQSSVCPATKAIRFNEPFWPRNDVRISNGIAQAFAKLNAELIIKHLSCYLWVP